MTFDENIRVRADCVSNRFDELKRANLISSLQLICAGAERVNLERFISLSHNFLRRFGKLLRHALGRVPCISLRLNLFSTLSSQELVYRLSHSFADDVPAGNLDGAHHCVGDDSAAPEVVAVHAKPEVFYIKRIAP